jgi:light-independent protochlorophyllide reductase subunit B
MGFEGANVLFDTWVHPLMMGLEEHLIGMFRGDAEFHEDAAPSHLGGHAAKPAVQAAAARIEAAEVISAAATSAAEATGTAAWAPGAEKELRKIPFFVRGKARRNTERFAHEQGLPVITLETLYDAKAHFSR